MSKEEQQTTRPWSIVGSFSTYKEADERRNSLASENKNLQVKIKK